MKTQKEVKEYALAAKDWIYVWGANGEPMTQALINRLYRDYGSASYPLSYYTVSYTHLTLPTTERV